MSQCKGRKIIKLLIDYGNPYVNGISVGISHALSQRQGWITRMHTTSLPWNTIIEKWKPDGIIAPIHSRAMSDIFERYTVPIVNISGAINTHNFPAVRSDDIAIGQMAAEYLLELHLNHFAFWGSHTGEFARRRKHSFVQKLIAAGVAEKNIHFCIPDMFMDIDRREYELKKWLVSLPKPIGLLASHDARAYYLNDIARSAGIDVPNEIALLSVDNDPLLCELSRPLLSSIALPMFNIGIKALETLEKMLNGQDVPKIVTLAPLEVVSRGSTEMLAVDDPDMVKTIMYIRNHATGDIQISDLLRQVPTSRRTLESKFKACFKRTIWEEIRRVRIQRAKKLLCNSQMPMPDIATQSGFNSSEYMSRVFVKHLNTTPSAYRRANYCPNATI